MGQIRLPTRDQMDRIAEAELRVELPTASLQPGEEYFALCRLASRTTWGVYQPLRYVVRQPFPRLADEPWLAEHGRLRGIPRGTANKARGYFLLTGPAAGPVQGQGSTIAQGGGARSYITAGNAPLVLPGWLAKLITAWDVTKPDQVFVNNTAGIQAGDPVRVGSVTTAVREVLGPAGVLLYTRLKIPPSPTDILEPIVGFVVQADATVEGEDGNLLPDTPCSLTAPQTGVNEAVVALLVADGSNEEELAHWAQRIEYAMSEYPAGGNRSQVVAWNTGVLTREDRDAGVQATHALGVADCFVYPLFRGRGTWDAVPRGAANGRHLTPTKRAALQAFCDQSIAMGADGKVTDFTDTFVIVSLQIVGHPGFEPDWVGTFTTAGAGSTTIRIATTANPVGTIAPDDRVALHHGGDVYVAQVANVDAGGITMKLPLPFVPTGGDQVLPGSAIVAPTRDAVIKLFQDFTPGDTVPPSRWPAVSESNPADLTIGLLTARVQAVSGLKNVVVLAPAFNITPIPKAQLALSSLAIRHV